MSDFVEETLITIFVVAAAMIVMILGITGVIVATHSRLVSAAIILCCTIIALALCWFRLVMLMRSNQKTSTTEPQLAVDTASETSN